MSWALFKANLRSNRIIWIAMTLVFFLYFAIVGTMYDPEGSVSMQEMIDMMPETILRAMGWNMIDTSLLALVSEYMYGLLLFMFPLVISIVINHRLIANHIDKGSMAFLLATPNSRLKIAITQAAFSIISITIFFIVVIIFGILFMEAILPGELEFGKFILLNVYALLLYYAIGSIGFFSSCIASESKHSLGLGIGIPIGFFVLEMIGNISDRFSWLGNLSMYALFDPHKLLAGSNFIYLGMLAFVLIAAVLYVGGIVIFNRRDLHV